MRERSYTDLISGSFLQNGGLPALTDYQGATMTYADVAATVRGIHDSFRGFGIVAGDRVALCGRNCSNWAAAFIAATTYGTVAVPLLHEFTPDNIIHAVRHSGSRMLFVSEEIWKTIRNELDWGDIVCVSLADLSVIRGDKRIPIDRFPVKDMQSFCDRLHRYAPEDMLVLNYTSGTTSNPKGVMIPERAVLSNILFGYEVMPMLHRGDTVVSLLPLAHTYSMAFELLTEFTLGMRIYFLTGRLHTGAIMGAFAEARPGVIIMVPLILEKIVKKSVVPAISKLGVKILRSTPGIKTAVNKRVRNALYEKLGGNFYQVIVGGAALDPESESLLREIRFPFTVGYGMTECAPIICYSDWKEFRPGTCGKAAPRMEIGFGREHGDSREVLVRGDNVMLGYYNNPEATAEVLDSDGWMHTGDLGELDRQGNLRILGRCKTMFLSSTGQNVYPEEIEAVVGNIKYVKECLAVKRGDRIAVLAYLDQEEIRKDRLTEEDIYEYKDKILQKANEQLPTYSRIAYVNLMEQPFEKTPKMSIKRYLYR